MGNRHSQSDITFENGYIFANHLPVINGSSGATWFSPVTRSFSSVDYSYITFPQNHMDFMVSRVAFISHPLCKKTCFKESCRLLRSGRKTSIARATAAGICTARFGNRPKSGRFSKRPYLKHATRGGVATASEPGLLSLHLFSNVGCFPVHTVISNFLLPAHKR